MLSSREGGPVLDRDVHVRYIQSKIVMRAGVILNQCKCLWWPLRKTDATQDGAGADHFLGEEGNLYGSLRAPEWGLVLSAI